MGATMYAHVDADGTITEWRMPDTARRLDSHQWVLGLRSAPPELQQACGWYVITSTPQPNDTDTHTHDRSIELVDGVPTVTWTARAKTADELAAVAQVANAGSLEAKARAALTGNGTYLALAAPTNAQTVAQVKALTRQMTALIRLSLRGDLLDNTTGT